MTLPLAALLAFLLGLGHSIVGERLVIAPLLRLQDLPKLFGSRTLMQRTLRFAWHLTTVFGWGLAWLLWRVDAWPAGAQDVASETLRLIGATMLVAALLPLVFTRGKHPAWVVLLAIGGIALAQA